MGSLKISLQRFKQIEITTALSVDLVNTDELRLQIILIIFYLMQYADPKKKFNLFTLNPIVTKIVLKLNLSIME
jgi:hypothetical protein